MRESLKVALLGALQDLMVDELDHERKAGLLTVVLYVCINELRPLVGDPVTVGLLDRARKDLNRINQFTLSVPGSDEHPKAVVH